ncbi:MAG: serine hydrolase [Phycisphaerales bacterium]|nr:serine hydrolase [Phycisphaerales bacterium]
MITPLRLLLACMATWLLAGHSAGDLPGLKKWMQQQVEQGKVVGCSAQVTQRGETVFLEAFGARTPASSEDLTTDQIARVYSMTKAITSTAVMQLIEQERLGIDDPVSMYIPEFADMTVGLGDTAQPARRQITIRDLLMHTSGLSYDFSAPTPYKAIYEAPFQAGGNLADAAAKMGQIPLVCEPGSRFEYGISIDVLGRVIEVVSGQTFGTYLQANLFEPLGMTDTTFFPPDDLKPMHIVIGPPGNLQIDQRHEQARLDRSLKPSFESGGGGLWSTLHDYTRFMQAMERYGELDGVRILKPKTVAFMTQNQLSPAFKSDQRFGLGFGLAAPVQTSRGPRGGGRWTWGGAASTYFFIDPKQDLTAIFVTQKFPFDFALGEEFHREVLESIAVTTPTTVDKLMGVTP